MPDYESRLQQLDVGIRQARSAQTLSVGLLVTALAVFFLLFLAAGQRRAPLWTFALPAPVVLAAGTWYARSRARLARALRLRAFYESGVARMQDCWHGTGYTGEEFRTSNHVYDVDLQILGEGSIFELLCTARTGIGRRRLAQMLLEPCDLAASQRRQNAVKELKPRAELRERIALLGQYTYTGSAWQTFVEWIATPAVTAPLWVRAAAFATSVALGALALAAFVTSVPAAKLLPVIPAFFAVDMAIAFSYRKRTTRLNTAARRVGIEIGVAREGMELILNQTFESAPLCSIQERLREENAAPALRTLERLTGALDQCTKPWFDLPSQALIVRTQLCFAIERWKRRHSGRLGAWLEAWAEFEALAAISGYAHEHPADSFPELRSGPPSLGAHRLGHPLIPSALCVTNDIVFDAAHRLYLVSGSNMSGKSTLMRSIGLNAVLAKAGAPVRAASMHLTGLDVFASLSLVDSILEGKSKFLAEVERVRQTLSGARRSPVLFLIDEIFSGTNSRDRRIAAESVVRELLHHGAIGALSTHDLALTEIAAIAGPAAINVHMGSRSGSDPLDFDYLLKPGVTTETNALAILAMVAGKGDAVRC